MTLVELKSIYIFVVLATLCSIHVNAYLFPIEPRNPLGGTPSPPGSPWPLPQEANYANDLVTIGQPDEFEYVPNILNCEPLEWAFGKFNYEFLFGTSITTQPENLPVFQTVYINLPIDPEQNQCNQYPKFSKDRKHEAYNLTINVEGDNAFAVINASTVWGALYGLETFSQLWYTNDWETEERQFFANITHVNDWPRFPHRGLMIDTARHYIPIPSLLNIIDAMFHNKLNVFHWHIVDDQSFPFVSTRFPDLSIKGAYNKKAIYTPNMVNQFQNAARLRGIRVIFEFDTPGHTNAMGRAYPEILTPCYGDSETPGTPNYPDHAAYENLDPTRETTYNFTRDLFTEIFNVSQDDYLHLGMDEVYYPCWNSSPAIKQFMEEHGYEELNEVQAVYTNRHLTMVGNLGAKSIIWQDPIDAGVVINTNVIIQIWKDGTDGEWINSTQQVLDQGYEILLSAPWYLNYINYGQSWRSYYEVDPVLDLINIEPGQENQILGGEVCMWAEYVDKTNIVPRIFPFASAVAERLWSAMNSSSTDDAMWRLDEHRCRLLWRGIPAQPILNGYCGNWEVDGK